MAIVLRNTKGSRLTHAELDGNFTHLDTTKEPDLGNPDADGKVLSSTTDGVRSWIAAGSGEGGDVEEAPSDGNLYARKDGDWTDITSPIQPTLTVEGSPSDVPDQPTLETSAFISLVGDTHLNTDWQIRNSDDTATIWESLADTSNKLSIKVPAETLSENTQYVFRVRHRGTTSGESAWQSVTATTVEIFHPMEIIESGPGPQTGEYDETTDTGYYGEVTDAEMGFPSDAGTWLASEIGLSAGSAQHSDAGFLKFYVGASALCNRTGSAYVLFVAKKPYRHSVSWDDIDTAGGVDGTTTVTVDGVDYKIRLMQGADADPSTYSSETSCADNPGENSEWNDLIYRIHTDVPDCDDPTIGMPEGNSTDRHGGPQVGDNWANLTDSDIVVATGDGRSPWCQEVDGVDSARRANRGVTGVAAFTTWTATYSHSPTGWRPLLELA